MHMSVPFKTAVLLGGLAVVLAGCTPSVLSRLSGAVAQAESFRYTYLKLRENADGRYLLPVRGIGGSCTAVGLTQAELETALRTHRVVIQQVRTGPQPVSAPVTVAFDLANDLGACGMGQIVEYATEDLQLIAYDANGVVTGRSRDLSVEAKYGNDAIARIKVKGFSLNGQVVGSRTRTGAIQDPIFEVAGLQVQGMAGERFESANIAMPIAEATVTAVADNPARVGIDFSFIAKADRRGKVILLVWDGSLMMRTDL